ncbi:hypothetical protein ASF43_23410 [Pseudorhodoferax sp. Leaf267]|nr:hypothetical protein ASF43_23410 [Pseudorhodoferax sp. Leaf267]
MRVVDDALNLPASAQPLHRMSDLESLVRGHVEGQDWAKVLEMGRLPMTSVHVEDRPRAAIWLLRVKTLALHPPGTESVHSLTKEVREELEQALEELAERVDAFHTLPQFDLYLATRRWSVEDNLQVFNRLTRACMEITNVGWILKLRDRALRLMNARDEDDEEVTSEQRALLESLPDMTLPLSEVYASAEAGGALDEEGRAFIKVLRLDLDLRMADPWDYGRVGDAVFALPSPLQTDLRGLPRDDPRGGAYQHLTPNAWAFMWELEHTSFEELPGVLERYQEPFICDACEGLRLVVASLVVPPAITDGYLAEGVRALMRFANDSPDSLGESVTVQLSEGPRELDIGANGLRMASVGDLLLRLYEGSPEQFSRFDELCSLYRIFVASTEYAPLENEQNGDENMPGLPWLCVQSLSFQFAAACVVQGVAGRMRLLLDALRRAVDADEPVPYNYYTGELAGEDLDDVGAGRVLEALGQLVPRRGAMDERAERLWRDVVAPIFQALSHVSDDVRRRAVDLARAFSADLLAKGESFQLGYLEQVAGDPSEALRYYLVNIDSAKDVPEVAVKNAKLLWSRAEARRVQDLVEILDENAKTSRRADLVRELLADAKARASLLNRQDQFERTAVNRWPSLTAPARKLLSVFASINSYNGLAEVAEYAGMEMAWAQRHYSKLVELGMLLVTDHSFRINPHIAPLLERESQHAVVGRIVRAQGTSAIKQVFNSQREFTIYQVLVQLCPNHLVFPNCSLQSLMAYERMKELVNDDDFGYYLRASVDIVVVSSTTYLPMLAIEVDSVWHDTERQQKNDEKKDRLFAAAGVPFMRLRPVGSPSESTVRAQVAEHVDELVRSLRADLPGYDQARRLLENLSVVG